MESGYHSRFQNDRPSFFKIMFDPAMGQLLIPSRFMKHLVKEAAERVTLKGPYGDVWTVGLHRNKNGTYIQDGWPEFARYHSLGNKEFLVFAYDGSLCFNVQIYDPSGLKRVGASVTTKHQGAHESSNEERKRYRLRSTVASVTGKRQEADSDEERKQVPCKSEAAPSTRGRKPPRKNKVDPSRLQLKNKHAPEVGIGKGDRIGHHQSEFDMNAPKDASKGKKKRGRPSKNEEIDTPIIHQPESGKHALQAASKGQKKCCKPIKMEEIDNPFFSQTESCKVAPEAAFEGKRKPGRPRKNKEIDTPILHQSESCKYAPETASRRKSKRSRPRK